MNPELISRFRLLRIPQVGPIQARLLIEHFGSAEAIFRAKQVELERIEGIGSLRAGAIRHYKGFREAEQEISMLEKFGIQALFLTDPRYPRRLLNCYDPPTMLFCRGSANLNASQILAIVGTRHPTAYGKEMTEKLVRDLATEPVSIISGLAYGIDALAHKACLKYGLPTIAVLAHGLDQVYPYVHQELALDITEKDGALITEFFVGVAPDKHHFPIRNRVVAGMSDAVVVIESGIKGGSMLTADLANGYNRDVFACPGRITDPKSEGCLQQIRQNKAHVFTSAADILQILGWQKKSKDEKIVQRELFVNLAPAEKIIFNLLAENGIMHIDEIRLKSKMGSSAVAAAMLNLELHGIVASQPGNRFRLV